MKIGFLGAHGTGKTTFVHELAEGFSEGLGWDVKIVSGVARSAPWPINKQVNEMTQRWIYHRHMQAEIEAENGTSGMIICDRTAIDALVYAAVSGFDKLVYEYLEPAIEWMHTYSAIYWMRPVPGRLIEDGQRDTDPEYQKQVDNEFEKWIKDYSIPVIGVKEAERYQIWNDAATLIIPKRAM